MARFLADENVPRQVNSALRVLGHEVLTVEGAGIANQRTPDRKLLELALEQNRMLLTFDRRDFMRLHNSGAAHAGIIICTFDPDFDRQATRIHAAITEVNLPRALIRINRPSS